MNLNFLRNRLSGNPALGIPDLRNRVLRLLGNALFGSPAELGLDRCRSYYDIPATRPLKAPADIYSPHGQHEQIEQEQFRIKHRRQSIRLLCAELAVGVFVLWLIAGSIHGLSPRDQIHQAATPRLSPMSLCDAARAAYAEGNATDADVNTACR